MWKVALDVGLDQPQPQEAKSKVRTYVLNFPLAHSESASADLEKTQRSFAESLKEDEPDAILDNPSDDIRICRDGQLPAVGKTAAKKQLSEPDAKTTRTARGAGTSNPLDLAYEYDEPTSEENHGTQRGIYLCIRRLESDGAWKIGLDFQKSAPTEKL